MIKHRSNNMNKKNEKNRQSAAAPRYAARSGATIALASDVRVTTTDKVIYGQTPPETDSPTATNSSEDIIIESSHRIFVRCRLRRNSEFSLLRSIRACKNGKHSRGGRSYDA